MNDKRARLVRELSLYDKFRCMECGCLWRLKADEWSLYDARQRPCELCDASDDEVGKLMGFADRS